jgi:hypothetical protein
MTTVGHLDGYTHSVSMEELRFMGIGRCGDREEVHTYDMGNGQSVIWGVPGPYSPRGFCYVEYGGGMVGVCW